MISSKAENRLALPQSYVASARLARRQAVKFLRSTTPKSRLAVTLGIGCLSVAASARMIHDHRAQHAADFALKPYVAPVQIAAVQPPAKKHKSFNPLHGIASWYGAVLHGHPTASGEIFDETKMTACHNSLPFGTRVRVTDLNSKKSVVVRINDRGVLSEGRVIDLSSAAAERLGILRTGIAPVKIDVLKTPAPESEND